jgi:hypothetical protein
VIDRANQWRALPQPNCSPADVLASASTTQRSWPASRAPSRARRERPGTAGATGAMKNVPTAAKVKNVTDARRTNPALNAR